jgi:hypothetical protein
MKTIDHDPNEPPRETPGEAFFVTVVTFVVLSGLVFGLKWLKGEFGLGVGLAGCAAVIFFSFALAFWLQAKTGLRRG